MGQHTPGPWSIEDGSPTSIWAGGHYIAETYTDGDANARLVVAAPEVLRAGKHLAVKLAEVYRVAGINPADCEALRDFMAIAARAEGR